MESRLRWIIAFMYTGFALGQAFDVGEVYKYEYSTVVAVSEPHTEGAKTVTFKVAAELEVSSVWESSPDSLLLLKVLRPKVHILHKAAREDGFKYHVSNLDSVAETTSIIHLRNGKLAEFFSPKEFNDITNVKRGIASLFQFQHDSGEVEEIDCSGHCRSEYAVVGSEISKRKIRCASSQQELSRITNDYSFKSLDAKLFSNVTTSIRVVESKHAILSAKSDGRHVFEVNGLQAGASIHTQQSLELLELQNNDKWIVSDGTLDIALKKISKVLRITLVPSGLMCISKDLDDSDNKFDTKPVLNDKLKSAIKVDNLGTVSHASAFLQLVQIFQTSKKDDILKLLKDKKNKNILPQLLDVAAAAQTPAAIDAAVKILNLKEGTKLDLSERFLIVLSAIPYASEDTLIKLVKFVQEGISNEKLHHTLVHTIASLAKKLFIKGGNAYTDTITEVAAHLTSKLEACSTEECRVVYLRALRNAGLPLSVPVLVDYVRRGGKSSLEAIKALQAMPKSSIVDEIKQLMIEVYFQLRRRYDSSARIAAANFLLTNSPCKRTIVGILSSFTAKNAQDSYEVVTYVKNMLMSAIKEDPHIKTMFSEIIKDAQIINYNTLSQKGSSASFTNDLARSAYLNSTYSVNLEMMKGGLLKQSSFDVHINSGQENQLLLSFGLYARGLGGISGDEPQDGEQEDTTAGLDIEIMGIALRPYVLFVGQGELMGLVWSGSGSTPTPIFQSNFLLLDERRWLSLENGFVVELTTLGALSLDMIGSIEISLWNRNSHSVIKDRAALVVHTAAKMSSDFVACQVTTSTSGDGVLTFTTDFEFYESPFKMCTQMSQLPFQTRHVIKKIERIPGTKHALRRFRRIYTKVPGRDYALHAKNSEFCAQMLK